MKDKREFIEDIKTRWLSRKKDTDMWQQFQGLSNEVSEGIYATDDHFIYELIQNAEDTESDEKVHTIEFVLEDEGLVVLNNETGFTNEQIDAICSFKKSTKIKQKNKGFIGEKGIGFKSVFKITDRPAISSNGYKFYFRRLDDDDVTEYIIPHWIEKEEFDKYPAKFQTNTNTALFLPFNKYRRESDIERLRQSILQIEPILLLFLNRLDSIKIYEKDHQVINTTKSTKKSENIRVVSIVNNQQKDKYYVFKKTIDVDTTLDEVVLKDGKRKEIKKREIVLAFPDAKNETEEDRIFAFLPTSLKGRLGFIIQADFILQAGRENIAIDNEWNQWQLDEIRNFITGKIIYEFQEHSKLKLLYLNYFVRYGESDNKLINKMYDELMEVLHKEKIILGTDEQWCKPKDILLLADDVKLESKYLKILYGERYEQVHSGFELPEVLAEKFEILHISKQNIIEKISDYFLHTKLNDLKEDIVFALTVFLSKYSSVDSRSREYDKELFSIIKKVLPIIPKYPSNHKFYYAKSIYLSDEYEPDFYLEDLADKASWDFSTFNFLSPLYHNAEQKGIEKFLRKILDELKEDNNKKTIEFMTQYPQYLQDYLLNRIKPHYEKVFDFLLDNQKDNLERIANIPLVLTNKEEFYSGRDIESVYFPTTNTDQTLKILNSTLNDVSQEKAEYRSLLESVFKVKEADIHNIILDQYLPWFKENRKNRNKENDLTLVEYTTLIVEHFEEFDRDQTRKIKESIYFIANNNTERYLVSGDIYLPQIISESFFHADSIEKYITDKSYFNFLGSQYDSLLSNCKNSDIKYFLNAFQFNIDSISNKDLSNFLRFLSDELPLEDSAQAFKIILQSDDFKDAKNKIEHLSGVKLYSDQNQLLRVNQLFLEKIEDISLPYLNEAYREKINFTENRKIYPYFQSPYRIDPFVHQLSTCHSIKEATEIYQYLDRTSNIIVTNKRDAGITPEKIKIAFAKKPLIFDSDGKLLYPNQTVWTQQQSANPLTALSEIYPETLQSFFIKKVQISQHRGIKQIVDQIKDIKKKTKEYYDLLVDLSQLVISREEIENYRKAYNYKIDQKQLSKDVYENAKMFLGKEEKIFINDMNKKMGVDSIFFNDIDIDTPRDLRESMLSLDYYGNDAFEGLTRELNVKCLSNQPSEHKYTDILDYIEIDTYREVLDFAYDLLFTKYYDQYKLLPEREEELRKINDIASIVVTSKIESILKINGAVITLNDEKYYINTDTNDLVLVDEKYISKAISNILGSISDKDLKYFMDEVLTDGVDKAEYYKEEGLKEKQDFCLEISNIKKEHIQSVKNLKPSIQNKEPANDQNDTEEEEAVQLTPEEEQERLQGMSPKEQIKMYENDGDDLDGVTEPVASGELEAKKDSFLKNIKMKTDKIREKHKTKAKPRKKSREKPKKDSPFRSGEEETKQFFRRKDQYAGHCQICGFTFKINNGPNYCERFTWTDSRKNNTVAEIIYPGNSLCLCGKCYSIINGGGDFHASFLEERVDTDELDDFIKKFHGLLIDEIPKIFEDHIEFEDMYSLPIRLNKKEEYIYFTEDHLIEFFAFLNENIKVNNII